MEPSFADIERATIWPIFNLSKTLPKILKSWENNTKLTTGLWRVFRMGIFKSLFGSNDEPKIRTKNDGFFGQLVYQEDSYWEGKALFKPTNAEVELIIDGDLNSPHSMQKRFFRELEKRYSAITEKLAEDFHEKLLTWRKDVSLCDLMRHVTLRCIHIPECRSESESWDLVYQIEDDNHSFVVVMVGWEAHGIQVEEVEE